MESVLCIYTMSTFNLQMFIVIFCETFYTLVNVVTQIYLKLSNSMQLRLYSAQGNM